MLNIPDAGILLKNRIASIFVDLYIQQMLRSWQRVTRAGRYSQLT